VAVVAAERSVTGGARPGRLAAGGRALRLPLGRWRWPAGVLVAGVVGLALACWTLQAPWPLATRIWNATEDAFLADASLAALVLLLLSGTLTWFLVVRDANAPT
jgi:hypothetical protein